MWSIWISLSSEVVKAASLARGERWDWGVIRLSLEQVPKNWVLDVCCVCCVQAEPCCNSTCYEWKPAMVIGFSSTGWACGWSETQEVGWSSAWAAEVWPWNHCLQPASLCRALSDVDSAALHSLNTSGSHVHFWCPCLLCASVGYSTGFPGPCCYHGSWWASSSLSFPWKGGS